MPKKIDNQPPAFHDDPSIMKGSSKARQKKVLYGRASRWKVSIDDSSSGGGKLDKEKGKQPSDLDMDSRKVDKTNCRLSYSHRPGKQSAAQHGIKLVREKDKNGYTRAEVLCGPLGNTIKQLESGSFCDDENKDSGNTLNRLFNSRPGHKVCSTDDFPVDKESTERFLSLYCKALKQESKDNFPLTRKQKEIKQERVDCVNEVIGFVKQLKDTDPDCLALCRLGVQLALRARAPKLVRQREMRLSGLFAVMSNGWRDNPLEMTRKTLKLASDYRVNIGDGEHRKKLSLPKGIDYTKYVEALCDKLLISSVGDLEENGNHLDDIIKIAGDLGIPAKKISRHKSRDEVIQGLEKVSKRYSVTAAISRDLNNVIMDALEKTYSGELAETPLRVKGRRLDSSLRKHCISIENVELTGDFDRQHVVFKVSARGRGLKIKMRVDDFERNFSFSHLILTGEPKGEDVSDGVFLPVKHHKEFKVVNDSRDSKVVNDSIDSKVVNDSRGSKVVNDSRDSKVVNDSRDSKVVNDSRNSEVVNDSRDSEVVNDSRYYKVVNDSDDKVDCRFSYSHRPGEKSAAQHGIKLVQDKDKRLYNRTEVLSGPLASAVNELERGAFCDDENVDSRRTLNRLFNSPHCYGIFSTNDFPVDKEFTEKFLSLYCKALKQESKINFPLTKEQEEKKQERVACVYEAIGFVKQLKDTDPDCTALRRLCIQLVLRAREPRIVRQYETPLCGVFSIMSAGWRKAPLEMMRKTLALASDYKVNIGEDKLGKTISLPKGVDYTKYGEALCDKLLLSSLIDIKKDGTNIVEQIKVAKKLDVPVKIIARGKSLQSKLEGLETASKHYPLTASITYSLSSVIRPLMGYSYSRKTARTHLRVKSEWLDQAADKKGLHAVVIENVKLTQRNNGSFVDFKLSTYGGGERFTMRLEDFKKHFRIDHFILFGEPKGKDVSGGVFASDHLDDFI